MKYMSLQIQSSCQNSDLWWYRELCGLSFMGHFFRSLKTDNCHVSIPLCLSR